MSNKLGQPEFPSFYWKVDINLGLISFNKEWANNILFNRVSPLQSASKLGLGPRAIPTFF
ncbi:MAG: hypothetical protein EBT02_01655 [Planctomycetia bacterium]|nr:hypothetical protein [Planctomycetia bacterium]